MSLMSTKGVAFGGSLGPSAAHAGGSIGKCDSLGPCHQGRITNML